MSPDDFTAVMPGFFQRKTEKNKAKFKGQRGHLKQKLLKVQVVIICTCEV